MRDVPVRFLLLLQFPLRLLNFYEHQQQYQLFDNLLVFFKARAKSQQGVLVSVSCFSYFQEERERERERETGVLLP